MKKLEDYVISIPDFPEPGILFRDITGILREADGVSLSIDELKKLAGKYEFDVIAGMESRGFIFGMPLAYEFHKEFLPVRKKGKLPRETVSQSYALEYGEAELEIHKGDLKEGSRVLIVDDLLATGGTAEAAAKLIEKCGGTVAACVFVMELAGLNGREKLKDYSVETVISYEGK